MPAIVRAAFGRTAEIAEMTWDDVRWDEHGQVVKVSWYEMKTSKNKAFVMAAGKTREDCVYLKSEDCLKSEDWQPRSGTSVRFQLSGCIFVPKSQE